jgi:SPP1 gp7 family putative phage head morphogenesis protein
VQELYHGKACACPDCGGAIMPLGAGQANSNKSVMDAANAAFKHLYDKGKYSPADLGKDEPYKRLIEATRQAFDPAIEDGKVPPEMAAHLRRDVHVFSGLKTHAQIMEATSYLTGSNGQRRPYHEFERDVLKINAAYNRNYLQAEYQFATSSAQMAGKWAGFAESEGRYDLQYRTAADDRVRISHQPLHNITLSYDDPFWDAYYPPNGWRCRCTAVETRKGKFERSDSAVAIVAGEKATTQIDKDGKNKLALFRFNPGKEKKLMPPDNPYTKVAGSQQAKAVMVQQQSVNVADFIKGDKVTSKEIKAILMDYANKFPEDFRNGLEAVTVRKSSTYMMQHTMNWQPSTGKWVSGSTIALSSHTFSSIGFNAAEEFGGAMLAIKKKEPLSFKQEYAVESMWHEILHAKTKSSPGKLSSAETQSMETLNQFCARHTYDQFLEKLGGKAAHKAEILENGYGYKTWVKEFRSTLDRNGIQESQALDDLMPDLLTDYRGIHKRLKEYLKPPQ